MPHDEQMASTVPSSYSDRLLTRLRLANLASQSAKEAALRTSGLNVALYGVLLVLRDDPGITSAEIARRTGVTAQTTSGLVSRLVDRGLIRRETHPGYGHVTQCFATPGGLDLLAAADAAVIDLENDLRASISDREAADLVQLLDRIGETARRRTSEARTASR